MAAGDRTGAGWELIGPLLPRGRGRSGEPGRDSRRMLGGIPWRVREGARWRASPQRYGKGNSNGRRFARWRDLGLFEALLAGGVRSGRGAAADARRHKICARRQGLSGIPCAGHDDGKEGTLAWHDAKRR